MRVLRFIFLAYSLFRLTMLLTSFLLSNKIAQRKSREIDINIDIENFHSYNSDLSVLQIE